MRRAARLSCALDLAACGFSTRQPDRAAICRAFAALPDAVHVRTLAAGSFEAITKRLGVLHALEAARRARRQRAARDRGLRRQVDDEFPRSPAPACRRPRPGRWNSFEQARALVRREIERGPLVLKPLFGAQGKGLAS